MIEDIQIDSFVNDYFNNNNKSISVINLSDTDLIKLSTGIGNRDYFNLNKNDIGINFINMFLSNVSRKSLNLISKISEICLYFNSEVHVNNFLDSDVLLFVYNDSPEKNVSSNTLNLFSETISGLLVTHDKPFSFGFISFNSYYSSSNQYLDIVNNVYNTNKSIYNLIYNLNLKGTLLNKGILSYGYNKSYEDLAIAELGNLFIKENEITCLIDSIVNCIG